MISVIVPIYNTKIQYLNKCIKSLINQDYKDFEVLLIDDGSKKEIADECEKITLLDSRVKVFHKENGGVSSARNLGLKNASGKYIAFVDADDWVDTDFLSLLVNAIKESDADLAISSIAYEYGEKETKNQQLSNRNCNVRLLDKSELYSGLLSSEYIGGFLWNKLFKKELILREMDENLHYCEDFEFVADYSQKINKAVFIDKKTYHYFKNENGITVNENYLSKYFSVLTAYEKIRNIYLINSPSKVAEINKNILKTALILRDRYKLSRVDNKDEYAIIQKTIKTYFLRAMISRKISTRTKLKLIAAYFS